MKPTALVLLASLFIASRAQAQDDAPTPPPSASAPPSTSASAPASAPVGHAAPATEAATRGPAPLRAGLEVFAEYNYRRTEGPGASTWFHSFELPRAHGAIDGTYNDQIRGRLVIEAVRSASEGALIGVSGDSLVLRVREAYAGYKPLPPLEITTGVIPTLTVPELDGTWMLRAVAPSGLEQSGIAAPADLGVKVRGEAPDNFGWAALSATNGEGYASRELNRGKTLEGALEVHPLPYGPLLPFGVFFSYTAGSLGTVSARADRLTTGLVWQGANVRAGAFFTYAWGVGQVGTQHAAVGSVFTRVEPIRNLLAGARFDVVVRDVANPPADAVSTLWLTVGYRIAEPLEVFLAGSRSLSTTRAEAEVPGSDAWGLRVISRVVF